MSLKLSISATELKSSFLINDCTGTYAFDNKCGFGIPNLRIEDIIESNLEIQPPSSASEYPISINVYPDFPNKEGDSYEVLPYMVGMQEIESGEWKFKLVVVFNKGGVKTTKTAYLTKVFVKTVECCIDKLTSGKLKVNAINDDKQKLILELSNLLEDVNYQIECGLNETANKNIEYLKSHCQCCGCH